MNTPCGRRGDVLAPALLRTAQVMVVLDVVVINVAAPPSVRTRRRPPAP